MAEAKFKLNLKTGEVEIEGSEEFVERQVHALEALVELMDLHQSSSSGSESNGVGEEDDSDGNVSGVEKPKNAEEMPSSFGEWMHSFKVELTDLDRALLTARYVQFSSPSNDFKTSEVNKSLKDHGVKLSNPSVSLKRLGEKKYLFQTRKVGKLRFMRVSADGQKYIESLRR